MAKPRARSILFYIAVMIYLGYESCMNKSEVVTVIIRIFDIKGRETKLIEYLKLLEEYMEKSNILLG